MEILNVAPEGFTFGRMSTKGSGYSKLYETLKKLEVGQCVIVDKNNGFDESRTAKHNKTNIMSCIGKQLELENYKFNCALSPDVEVKAILIRCEVVPQKEA